MRQQHLQESLELQPVSKEPKAVEPSKAAAISYNARLQQLVRAIKKDIDREIVPLVRNLAPQYTSDSFIELMNDGEIETFDVKVITKDGWVNDITNALGRLFTKWTGVAFEQLANQTANEFVRTADQVNQRKFNASMRSMGIDVFGSSPAIDEMLQAAVYDNTRLIQSIPAQYLKQVESIVMTNMRAGLRPSSITKQLMEQFGVTHRRAKLIARDQTSRINGDLNKQRQQDAGVKYFRWQTSDDERVRHKHTEHEEKVTKYGKGVYSWDNPPLEDGKQVIPGSPINCRCVAIYIPERKVRENQESGKVNPSVKR